ncbi:MAG: hypothetical protein KGR98_11060, partial [Verrucomicrobia bacterium]|nr:hypothetical protein [Verrucomicrobiota bacterium]
GPSPLPFAEPIAISPSAFAVPGTQVTLNETTTNGAPPLHYQWQTDGGTGGTLTNIPASDSTNLVVDTTGWTPGAYQFDVVVNNNYGSSTSKVATLTVVYANANATLTEIGATVPAPLPNDISQLNPASGANKPDGLNYYFDNGVPPGQTFTTGNNPGGYILSTVAISMAGNSGQLPAAGQAYLLRIYTVSGGNATLYATYTSQSNFVIVTDTDWLRWSGFAVPLAPNSTYAYSLHRTVSGWDNLANVSGNPYAGGEVCLIPSGGGAISFGSSHDYDGVFVAGLALSGYPAVSPPAFSPSSTVYAGTPVVLSASVSGAGPFTYQWQTDGGSGTFTNIPGATSATLTVDTTGMDGMTVGYDLVVGNAAGMTTGEVSELTVNPASAPVVVQDITPSAPDPFVGRAVTFSASFAGTLPISYQWQVDKGTGATNIVGQTNTTLTLANLALSDAGSYTLVASNSIASAPSSSATLTVQPLPTEPYASTIVADNPLAYYPLNEPSGSMVAHDVYNAHDGTNAGAAIFGVPGVPNPPFLGFSATNTALQTSTNSAGSWVSAPFGSLGLSNVTFSAWIYPMGTQPNWAGIIMSRGGGASGGLSYNGNQMLTYNWNNNSTWNLKSGLVIPTNQWSFVAMVIEPTQATLYLYNTSGLLSWTNLAPESADVFGNNWRIGNDADGDPGRTFNGEIQDVAIYGHSLSPTQIQQLYSAGASAAVAVQISIQRSGSNVVLSWPQGTLLEATNLAGPWITNTAP